MAKYRSRLSRKTRPRKKSSRRYAGKTRRSTYRKRSSKYSSKKRMMNMMSRKKRDTMLSQAAAAVNPDPNSTTVDGPLKITANTVSTYHAGFHVTLQCPSYRWLNPNNAAYLALRTDTRPFIRGLAEQYELVPDDASVWMHRRIVFATKSRFVEAVMANIGAQPAVGDANSHRQFRDMSGTTSGNYTTLQTQIFDIVFRGVDTTDWRNPMLARVDTARVDLLSDVRHQISSNNDVGRTRYKKFWTPVNKTIHYDDEENGLSVSPAAMSVMDKRGMGNIFVLDLFECINPHDDATQLSISTQQTLYWHEK